MTNTTSTTNADFNILNQLRNRFLLVELKGRTGIRATTRYDAGKAIIIANKGGDDSAYSVSQKLYPKGYDDHKNALTKAYNAVRSHFYAHTMPYQHNASGSAAGKRLVSSEQIMGGTFMSEHNDLIAELDNARESFARSINAIVDTIEAQGVLGDDFDRANYPSPDEIRESYHYEPLQPMPIPGDESIDGLPVPTDMAQSMSESMQAQAHAEYRFGVQSQARETLDYLTTMASNLSRLVEWHNTDEGSRQKRQPAIYDSLFKNVEHAVDKLRSFAIPETEEGSRMLEIAEHIDASLRPGELEADQVRTDLSLAEQQAQRAQAAAAAIDECGLL